MTIPPETPQRSEHHPEPAVARKARDSGRAGHVSSALLVSLGARVRRAQQGDPRALDLLFRSFQSMAVGYAASLLGDTQRAEDVAQEAFLEALTRLASLRVPEAFPGLLKALIRKHCDRLTRRRCLAVTSLEDAPEKTESGTDPMHSGAGSGKAGDGPAGGA
jgi:hypothetical protein